MKNAIRTLTLLASIALAAALATGCGHSTPTEASTPNEIYVLSQTDVYAKKLGVNVYGVLSDKRNTYGCETADCVDYGWYLEGKAVYWRPGLAEMPNQINIDLLAAHETCHAVSRMHDTRHWCCVFNLTGSASYPPPQTVQGQWPTCQ